MLKRFAMKPTFIVTAASPAMRVAANHTISKWTGEQLAPMRPKAYLDCPGLSEITIVVVHARVSGPDTSDRRLRVAAPGRHIGWLPAAFGQLPSDSAYVPTTVQECTGGRLFERFARVRVPPGGRDKLSGIESANHRTRSLDS